MALRFEVGWDFARIGSSKMTVTENTGSLAFQIVCDSSGVQSADSLGVSLAVADADTDYCHTDLTGVMGTGNYDDFATALKAALDAGSAAHGNTRTYTVTWSGAGPSYTISVSAGTIALAFASHSAAGTRMRQILGLSGDKSTAASHASDVRPYYVISSATGAKSRVKEDYNFQAVSGAVSMGGAHYAIAPSTFLAQHDFECMFEAKAAVMKRSASASVPWTYQHLWEHAHAAEPILVADGTENTVHFLRAEAADWNADRYTDDWDMWTIRFETYVEGRL